MWLIIQEKNTILNIFHTYTHAVCTTEGTQPQKTFLKDLGKGEKLLFQSTSLNLGLGEATCFTSYCPSASAICCHFWLLELHSLFPTLYFSLYLPRVSPEHSALQALGICRSCFEILLCERKKESCFLTPKCFLPFKTQWIIFLLWLQMHSSAKIKHRLHM